MKLETLTRQDGYSQSDDIGLAMNYRVNCIYYVYMEKIHLPAGPNLLVIHFVHLHTFSELQ